MFDEVLSKYTSRLFFFVYNGRESDVPGVCSLERGKGWNSFSVKDIYKGKDYQKLQNKAALEFHECETQKVTEQTHLLFVVSVSCKVLSSK